MQFLTKIKKIKTEKYYFNDFLLKNAALKRNYNKKQVDGHKKLKLNYLYFSLKSH